MNLMTSSYCGSIWHHGIKGQKWGVRRTPEELGHRPKGADGIEKSQKRVKIVDGVYHSEKGFTVESRKFSAYFLKPEAPHSKQFFDVGYRESDSQRLFLDMERAYDEKKKVDVISESGREKFSIPMQLGVTATKTFRTVWQKDKLNANARFVTAYIDRRMKED